MKIFRVVIILLALLIVGGLGLLFLNDQNAAVDKNNTDPIYFTISEGETPSEIMEKLEKQDIIRSHNYATRQFTKNNYVIYSGTYKVSKSMTTSEILLYFQDVKNANKDVNFTIREGETFENIIADLEKVSSFTNEELMQYFNSDTTINNYISKYWFITDEVLKDGIRYKLEGYLTPASYYITEEMSLEEIGTLLLSNSEKQFEQYKDKQTPNDLTFHQVLTLASIIERETITDEDKNKVAGVFFNRLNSSEYPFLQSDITVLYGLNTHKEVVTYKDLEVDSPYNTYKVEGIPIGPINSPSIASIDSVYNYEKNDYLFFYADKSGKVYYTKTLDEHNEIIKKYGN